MILSNQVRCNECGDEPFSRSVHHYNSCNCGNIAVDGGTDYLRRVGNIHNYTDMSIEIPNEAGKAAMEAIQWAKDNGRNNYGILCAVARALRDNGIQLCPKTDT